MSIAPEPAENDRSGADIRSFARILKHARPYWFKLGLSVAILIAAGYAGVSAASYLGKFVQQGLVMRNHDLAVRLGLLVLALELVSVAASYYGRLMMAEAANASLLLIRRRLFTHLNQLPMSYFDQQPLGRTVTRLTYDVEGLEDFFGGTLARIMNAFLNIAIVLAAMMATDLRIGLIIMASMLPAVLVTWLSRKSVRHWNREFSRRNSAINAKLSELLSGIPVIRYFGAESWSSHLFDDVIGHHLESAIKINVINSLVRPIVQLLCAVPRIILLYFGGVSVMSGALPLGVFVAFLRFTERLSSPVTIIAHEIQTIQAAFTSAERVGRFLDTPTEATALGPDGTLAPKHVDGEIEFRHVTMAYNPEQPVLRDVSFHVRAGEKIGLVGRTGSGKSTTAALISRLYEFQRGDILVDGKSVRDYQRDALRLHIGFVNQDVTIFRGSLIDNLAFGAPVSRSDIAEACHRTGLGELMESRALTLDSEILDQGANLSAGERQLVALTRTLIRNPSLLILDEATANVDEAHEELLQNAVLSVMNGRTCLMIAHRLSTLEACDRILVFKDGAILEEGSHEKLVALGGYYAQLIHESRRAQSEATVTV
ncbi:MAG: ABC transporter ATP-binding protein [Bdellovibrionales bacterium]|nr:ABC transporter ATP-binding protein [Bdellovibrionales bacterium]